MLLSKAFGLETYSLHGDNDPEAFGSEQITRLVGHRNTRMSPEELVSAAKSDGVTCIVKTHEHPITNDPCIFVVRDGRSSIVSYFHFLNEIARTPVSLEQVIKGEVFAGSWSEHYIAWQPKIRAHTLLLRYEMIVADPRRAISEISSFLRINPSNDFCMPFETLRSINSKFFRSGSDEKNIRELDGLRNFFWNHHGPVMLDLGYGRGDREDSAIPVGYRSVA